MTEGGLAFTNKLNFCTCYHAFDGDNWDLISKYVLPAKEFINAQCKLKFSEETPFLRFLNALPDTGDISEEIPKFEAFINAGANLQVGNVVYTLLQKGNLPIVVDRVKYFLEKGAPASTNKVVPFPNNPKYSISKNSTFLLACLLGNPEIMQLLVDKGA